MSACSSAYRFQFLRTSTVNRQASESISLWQFGHSHIAFSTERLSSDVKLELYLGPSGEAAVI